MILNDEQLARVGRRGYPIVVPDLLDTIAGLKGQLAESDHIEIGTEHIPIEEAALRLDRQAETIKGLLKAVEPFVAIGLDAYVQKRVDEAVLVEHKRVCPACLQGHLCHRVERLAANRAKVKEGQ